VNESIQTGTASPAPAPLFSFHGAADRSESIGALVGALALAQSEIRAADKDRENPFYKSSYSTLASVWAACREQLGKNGIAVIQVPQLEGSAIVLYTWLAHKSGEWMRSRYPVNPAKHDPQGIGSAVSYARRYALAAMVGVYSADEDDDGEAASEHPRAKPAAKGAPAVKNGEVATGAGKSANGATEKPADPPKDDTSSAKPSLGSLKAEIDAVRTSSEPKDAKLAALKAVGGKIAKQPKNIQQALIPVYNAAKAEIEKSSAANGSAEHQEVV
jgi:hypothetical protein